MRPVSAPEQEHALSATGPRRTAAAWLLGIAATAVFFWGGGPIRGYHAPSLHLVLDTVDACVALLAATLAYGRLVRGGSPQDPLPAPGPATLRRARSGLALLALAGSGLAFAAGQLTEPDDGTLEVWLPLSIRLLGAMLIVAAALCD